MTYRVNLNIYYIIVHVYFLHDDVQICMLSVKQNGNTRENITT